MRNINISVAVQAFFHTYVIRVVGKFNLHLYNTLQLVQLTLEIKIEMLNHPSLLSNALAQNSRPSQVGPLGFENIFANSQYAQQPQPNNAQGAPSMFNLSTQKPTFPASGYSPGFPGKDSNPFLSNRASIPQPGQPEIGNSAPIFAANNFNGVASQNKPSTLSFGNSSPIGKARFSEPYPSFPAALRMNDIPTTRNGKLKDGIQRVKCVSAIGPNLEALKSKEMLRVQYYSQLYSTSPPNLASNNNSTNGSSQQNAFFKNSANNANSQITSNRSNPFSSNFTSHSFNNTTNFGQSFANTSASSNFQNGVGTNNSFTNGSSNFGSYLQHNQNAAASQPFSPFVSNLTHTFASPPSATQNSFGSSSSLYQNNASNYTFTNKFNPASQNYQAYEQPQLSLLLSSFNHQNHQNHLSASKDASKDSSHERYTQIHRKIHHLAEQYERASIKLQHPRYAVVANLHYKLVGLLMEKQNGRSRWEEAAYPLSFLEAFPFESTRFSSDGYLEELILTIGSGENIAQTIINSPHKIEEIINNQEEIDAYISRKLELYEEKPPMLEQDFYGYGWNKKKEESQVVVIRRGADGKDVYTQLFKEKEEQKEKEEENLPFGHYYLQEEKDEFEWRRHMEEFIELEEREKNEPK